MDMNETFGDMIAEVNEQLSEYKMLNGVQLVEIEQKNRRAKALADELVPSFAPALSFSDAMDIIEETLERQSELIADLKAEKSRLIAKRKEAEAGSTSHIDSVTVERTISGEWLINGRSGLALDLAEMINEYHNKE